MRNIFLFMMVSVDGYFEGVNHDLSWHNVDEEFNEFAVKQLQNSSDLFFGRRTYELMVSYWTSDSAKQDDPEVAGLMNDTRKFVFSHTLKDVRWKHTNLINKNIQQEIMKLKNQRGREIAVLGSNNFAETLLQRGLLDEIRLMVNPVIIGKGHRLFYRNRNKFRLKLLSTKVFQSGNVLFCYKVLKK